MIQKVLVTGGLGFIGQHLVTKLLAEGCHIRILSRNVPEEYQDSNKVHYFPGDFTRAEDTTAALNGVQAVYHLAVTTVPGRSNDQIQYDAHTNLMGSLTLIEQAAKMGVQRFIFTSSGGSVYGPTGREPIHEDHPTNPISAHGVSKLAVEKYLEIFRRKYGMQYRVARGGNPYGEGQDPFRGQGFIAYALGCLAEDREIVIWGDGSVERDFVYVSDVAEALWFMLRDEGTSFVYNVGSGRGRSLNEIVSALKQVTNRETRVRYEEARPADVPYNTLDISRIQEELGWEPHTDLFIGLEKTWAWICQRIGEDQDMLSRVS